MIYQDVWKNGKLVSKGTRSCADRYEVVRANCGMGWSVLDIGANMCYFGIRLIEDLACNVMAFEFNSFEMRQRVVGNVPGLLFLKRKLTIQDLESLSRYCHFDLVLAMSVVHHLPGNTTEWINSFRRLGDTVMIEFALEDSPGRVSIRKDYTIPVDGQVIGYGDSHLKKDFKRPIILLKNESSLQRTSSSY